MMREEEDDDVFGWFHRWQDKTMMTLRMVTFLFGFTDGWIVSNGHVRLLLFERLGRLRRWLILALMLTLCLFRISLFSAWLGSAKKSKSNDIHSCNLIGGVNAREPYLMIPVLVS